MYCYLALLTQTTQMEEVIDLDDITLNLTPPDGGYNTSLASEIVTISGLPFGIGAVIANVLLITCKCRDFGSNYRG